MSNIFRRQSDINNSMVNINKNRILCAYCHMFHLKEHMPNGICPKMTIFAKDLQDKHSYLCNLCEGEGKFERIVETKLLQYAQKYEEKLKIWKQTHQQNNSDQLPPERKVIKVSIQTKDIVCEECQGKGKIYRMISMPDPRQRNVFCKGSEQLKVNPSWIKYRMKSRVSQEIFNCSICLMEGGKEEKNFILSCHHEFHYSCIFRWLKLNDKCPICRHIDPFIDMKYLDEDDLEENHRMNSVLEGVRMSNRPNRNSNPFNRGQVYQDGHSLFQGMISGRNAYQSAHHEQQEEEDW